MGAYLSKPITDKVSADESGTYVNYGASSMQGWRESQEDAHNSIINYDKETCFFAVYDGHGGHEVAAYCAENLPEYIKDVEAYKKGNLSQALMDAFLGFDATLATEEVMDVLKQIAKSGDDQLSGTEDEDDAENINHLYKEAEMPLDQVIAKYQSDILNPSIRRLQEKEKPLSPCLRGRKDGCGSSSSSQAGPSCSESDTEVSSSSPGNSEHSFTNSSTVDGTSNEALSSTQKLSDSDECDSKADEAITKDSSNSATEDMPDSSGDAVPGNKQSVLEAAKAAVPTESEQKKQLVKNEDKKVSNEVTDYKSSEMASTNVELNGGIEFSETECEKSGEVCEQETSNEKVSSSSAVQENGEVVSETVKDLKGKGKAKVKPKISHTVGEVKEGCLLRERSAAQLYRNMLDGAKEDSDSDEDDENFEGIESTDDEEELCDEDDMEEDEEEEEEEDDDDIEDALCCDDDDDDDFTMKIKDRPDPNDCGCTAVVAVLKGRELYVANAGDSRCVVSRKGEAIEMSLDHKPEDAVEKDRIVKAGGKVTWEGRVNGGLNLSRAIGDHAYKQAPNLSAKEQMITALPDVRTLTIDPEQDEFMVLACDGIWNFMSSQEVVDFVRQRIEEGREKLSLICEELFDHCLAPNTLGDGTGCDNMTAIIVKFNPSLKEISVNSLKRTPSSENVLNDDDPKRQKLENATAESSVTV